MRLVDGQARLLGGRCSQCGHATVPRRNACPSCHGETVGEVELGPTGSVISSVELYVPTAGVEAPYWVGLVKLSEGPTLFTRLAGAAGPGSAVELVVEPETDSYWFAASQAGVETASS
ncbi:MAG TPA: OB-fold domain-containing protein [Candidatus Dormibacteraeota bacterium]